LNLGAGEILLLAIFVLVLFGPKRLPDIGRQVGRALAELRRVSREFEDEVREVTEPFEREVRAAIEPIEPGVRELEREVRKTYELDEDHSSFAPREPKETPKD
jgi:TatA/E family protein of Tat protein translocase